MKIFKNFRFVGTLSHANRAKDIFWCVDFTSLCMSDAQNFADDSRTFPSFTRCKSANGHYHCMPTTPIKIKHDVSICLYQYPKILAVCSVQGEQACELARLKFLVALHNDSVARQSAYVIQETFLPQILRYSYLVGCCLVSDLFGI